MFLRFGVENFRSFRDRTEVSFVATRLDDGGLRFECSETEHGVLPLLVAFGANGSGKSNLLAAFQRFSAEIATSAQRLPEQRIDREQFALGATDSPTSFDVDVMTNGVRYHYGFALADDRIDAEWLYSWPEGRRRVLFERGLDEPWYFGPSLKGEKAQIAALTKPNTLFLSMAAQLNHELLTSLYQKFSINAQSTLFPSMYVERSLVDGRRDSTLLRLLSASDLGVVGLRTSPISDEEEWRALRDAGGDVFDPVFDALSKSFRLVKLQHQGPNGPVELRADQESLGTRAFLHRFAPMIQSLETGQLVVIDEFDQHLHPLLAAQLIKLFRDPETNPNRAQLVCTAHDSSLMNLLRRDEILLVEKSEVGVSEILAASDLRIRKGSDLRSLYESGRMGGVPRLDDLTTVLG